MEDSPEIGGSDSCGESLSAEQELIKSAKEGSEAAQALLYRAFFDPLVRHLSKRIGRKLGRAVSISDLAQDAFINSLAAMRVLPIDAGTEEFRGILYRHARWMIGKAVKKHQGFQGESAIGDRELEVAVPARGSSQSLGDVTRADESNWLAEQIEKLPQESAEVLRLRLDSLGLSEIAERLGIPYDTAKKRVQRASQRLSEMIGQRDEECPE